jgi:hypothetical protein
METQLHQTREAWLNYVARCTAPMFEELGVPLPAQLRIAIGFTSSGRRSRNIGECTVQRLARRIRELGYEVQISKAA